MTPVSTLHPPGVLIATQDQLGEVVPVTDKKTMPRDEAFECFNFEPCRQAKRFKANADFANDKK
jgi:hypothetical protein